LKGLGLSFQGPSIDTLELVQWLLPTHHSYNLENLMHYFKVPHQEAHRALADSKAAVRILEKLLIKYVSFPTKLKNNVKLYFSKLKPSWGKKNEKVLLIDFGLTSDIYKKYYKK
jgi:DNA polymerase III alpha subunit (gram-positive type)